ncbi:M15 family metallopeptidase [Arthrobacter sp. Soil782]|uniref:M15 family metallopeptidase n=1 Tax=Arthrobacter sp. Soil782 TaxID=1736410 RepID=UPI001F372E64|nr:M15 family metallopeptidase [Arthrobacter sp. Soil782]
MSQTPGTIPAPGQRAPAPVETSAPSVIPETPPAQPTAAPSVAASPSPPPPVAAPPAEAAELGDPTSVSVVVNKQRPLNPIDYFPSGLVLPAVPLAVAEPNALLRGDTAAAVEEMFATAANDGVSLTLVSGYRSFQDQVSTYEHWVAQYGGDTAAADRISARAGFSEHQTGLAFDVGQDDGACTLSSCFADTAAGQWMAANAHRFGFILRYPLGAEGITGFSGEAWHYRYVGVELAQAMRKDGVATLEEYFNLPPAPGY